MTTFGSHRCNNQLPALRSENFGWRLGFCGDCRAELKAGHEFAGLAQWAGWDQNKERPVFRDGYFDKGVGQRDAVAFGAAKPDNCRSETEFRFSLRSTELKFAKHSAAAFCIAMISICGTSSPVAVAAHSAETIRPIHLTATLEMSPVRARISRSFMGLSIEWGLVDRLLTRKYGRQKTMIRLLNMLGRENGPPVLRIGGNSQDEAAFDLSGERGLPKFVHINISPRTLERLAEVSKATGCRLIIGLNLAVNRPALAAKLVRECRKIIGDKHILAYEIGNEPDFFRRFGGIWKKDNFKLYLRRWNRYDRAINALLAAGRPHIEGPAFGGGWNRQIPNFIKRLHQKLNVVGLHRYALGAPVKNPESPEFASIPNLLKNSSAKGFVRLVGPIMRTAAVYHLPVRYTEMNSAWGGGKLGVSDTFASALWCTDTLFEIANAGLTGVNIHLSEGLDQFGGYYGPVYFKRHQPLRVRPMFYGMLLFANAIAGRSELINVHIKQGQQWEGEVNIWAVRAGKHTVRVVIINKNMKRKCLVRIDARGARTITEYRLWSPAMNSVYGLRLRGQSFDGGKNGRLTGQRSVSRPVQWTDTSELMAPPHSISVYIFHSQTD